MTRAAAEQWAMNSAWRADLFHATATDAVDTVKKDGFVPGNRPWGMIWGAGVYVALNRRVADWYRDRKRGVVMTVKVNIRKPAEIIVDNDSTSPELRVERFVVAHGLRADYDRHLLAVRKEIRDLEARAPRAVFEDDRLLMKFYAENNVPHPINADMAALQRTLRGAGYDALIVKQRKFGMMVGGAQMLVFDPKNVVVVEG